MENIFSLNGCLAVKQGDFDKAKQVLESVATLDDKIFIQTVKDVFLMVIRRHNEDLLTEWFGIVDSRLRVILGKEEMFAENQDFLEAMLFAIGDHRLDALQARFDEYFVIFQNSRKDIWDMKAFYIELASLSARMSLRKWDKQAQWLLKLILKAASEQPDLKFIEHLLYYIDLNSIMYAKNFGAGAMYILYRQVQFSYMYLVSYAAKDNVTREYKKEAMTIALRGERNLMSNLARITMKDEMDIYEEWYHHMLYIFGKHDKLKPLSILLVQLTVLYWNRTQPKSSRKQVKYLQKILEPSHVRGIFTELLEEIS